MTEKRFEIIKSAIIDGARVIKDNENKYTFATTFETATLINYRKALNELNDKNEQLKNHIQELQNHLKRLENENIQTYTLIKEAYHNERTQLGKSVLKQLLEAIQ